MGLDIEGIRPSISESIRTVGWSVVGIEDANPVFAVSIGLPKYAEFPELVVVGLPAEEAQSIINAVALISKKGKQYRTRREYTDIIEDHRIVFVDVDDDKRHPYFEVVEEFHGDANFRAWQLVYPDVNDRLPWEEGCDQRVLDIQPVLNGRIMGL